MYRNQDDTVTSDKRRLSIPIVPHNADGSPQYNGALPGINGLEGIPQHADGDAPGERPTTPTTPNGSLSEPPPSPQSRASWVEGTPLEALSVNLDFFGDNFDVSLSSLPGACVHAGDTSASREDRIDSYIRRFSPLHRTHPQASQTSPTGSPAVNGIVI